MTNELTIDNNAISFGERLATSSSFKTLFRDGMALVEETAAYLDGDGREDAKKLPRLAALGYASESMRLTTRLMQIASWLLLQRAVNEGEMTQAEASSDKRRTRISWQVARVTNTSDVLPERLLALIESSVRLQERIVRLDALISDPRPATSPTFERRPIEQQMSRLRDAFCG
jgi:regulator of CtrA degradation